MANTDNVNSMTPEQAEEPQHADPLINDLLRTVRNGHIAKQFLNSEVGNMVYHRMHDEIDAAKEALTSVDCRDVDKVRELQNRIRIAKTGLGWLFDAVGEGEVAYLQLQNLDQ